MRDGSKVYALTSKRKFSLGRNSPNASAPRTATDLREADRLLTAVTARILQTSPRKARAVIGASANVLSGSAFASVVTGMVGTFGTASTGAAIAGLGGAAKTTATLYWIGGLVGGGVAAGTLVLSAGAVGAGIYASVLVRRWVLGAARPRRALPPEEARILEAARVLAKAIETAQAAGRTPSDTEVRHFFAIGVGPLAQEITACFEAGGFEAMTSYNRALLRGHARNLARLNRRVARS